MSHVSNERAEVDVRRQQVLRASWADTASSGSIVNSSSSAAVSDVHIQRYDAPSRLSQNITRPIYPPSCLPESPNFHDAVARWKPSPADRAPYPPPSYRLPAAALNGSIPYPGVVGRGSTVVGRGSTVVGRGSTLCHVDPVVRGACVACEYIRHNARSSRYEPYSGMSRRGYAKSTHHTADLRHTAYY